MEEEEPSSIHDIPPREAALALLGYGSRSELFLVVEECGHAMTWADIYEVMNTLEDEEDEREMWIGMEFAVSIGFIRMVGPGKFIWNYGSEVGQALSDLFFECEQKAREVRGLGRLDGKVEGDFHIRAIGETREFLVDGEDMGDYNGRTFG